MKLAANFIVVLVAMSSFCFSQSRPLVISNVAVIDMTGARPKQRMSVVIVEGRITELRKTDKIKVPQNAEIIDGRGKFLIPAFWDMHVHIRYPDIVLPLFVANGVLGVRDMGSRDLDNILQWRDEVARGIRVGPRIVTAGRVLDGVPQADPAFSIPIKDTDDGRNAVHSLKERNVDLIKVYDNLTRDAYLAIVDEAKKLKLPFAGHVPSSVSSIEASDIGQKSIEHLGKILEDSADAHRLAAVRAEKIPKGDFFAFTTRLGKSYDTTIATLDPAKEKSIFSHFLRNGTWQVPTLSVKYARTFIDDLDAKGDPNTKYVEASQVEYWKPKNGFFSRYRTLSYIAAQKRFFSREKKLVGEMVKAGVKIMAGTDTPNAYVIAGFSLHDELQLMVASGMTPMQVLLSATRNPAEYLGELAQSGTVEKGKIADLILLDADPLADIKNTTRINAVIQKGRFISRNELDQMLSNVESLVKKMPN
jgi:imidazolonepropionase-like amidohydrolase